MSVTLRTERRADGMLDFSYEGVRAFRSVLHPRQLSGQLSCANVYFAEREVFQSALNAVGAATISFPPRWGGLSAG